MAQPPAAALPASLVGTQLPSIPLPAIPSTPAAPAAAPPPTTAAPAPSSTPAAAPKPKQSKKKKPADDAPDGEPKPKKKKPSKPKGEAGPGKAWRKGVKGNLAGVGLDPSIGAQIHAAVGTGASLSLTNPGSPAPGASTPGGAASTAAIGAPPKLGNQFLPSQSLQVGTPRPRKWRRGRVVIKSITGRALGLPSWQGDEFSAYAIATGTSTGQVDELASPPLGYASPSLTPVPAAVLKPRASAAVAAGGHLMSPLSSSQGQAQPPQTQYAAQPLAPPLFPPAAAASVPLAPPVFPPSSASASPSLPHPTSAASTAHAPPLPPSLPPLAASATEGAQLSNPSAGSSVPYPNHEALMLGQVAEGRAARPVYDGPERAPIWPPVPPAGAGAAPHAGEGGEGAKAE
ncbi:hypothetical protein JCM8097_002689 [Rhodosporidiobolus ruineniae]